jgi:predicted cation transporter
VIQDTLMGLIGAAVIISAVVTGIVEAIKRKVEMTGLQTIILAILTGVLLLGLVAFVFDYPMAESLLLGLLSGLGSIGAFEGIDKTRKKIVE